MDELVTKPIRVEALGQFLEKVSGIFGAGDFQK
jgi:hypothetical protein